MRLLDSVPSVYMGWAYRKKMNSRVGGAVQHLGRDRGLPWLVYSFVHSRLTLEGLKVLMEWVKGRRGHFWGKSRLSPVPLSILHSGHQRNTPLLLCSSCSSLGLLKQKWVWGKIILGWNKVGPGDLGAILVPGTLYSAPSIHRWLRSLHV